MFDPASLLPLLVSKPGAGGYSLLRSRVPHRVRDRLDTATATERRVLLNAVDAAIGPAGFGAAVQAGPLQCFRTVGSGASYAAVTGLG